MSSFSYTAINFLMIAICLLGLSYQIYQISDVYFSYVTHVKASVLMPSAIKPPVVSACFHISGILNRNMTSNIPRRRYLYPDEDNFSYSRYDEQVASLSLNQIFDLTPKIDNILNPDRGCDIRFPGDKARESYDSYECHRYFNITKYIHREYICYSFHMNSSSDKLVHELETQLTTDAFGAIFKIIFDANLFKHVPFITAYVHDSKSVQLLDAMYTEEQMVEKITFSKPDIALTYQTIHRQLMSAPYEDDCVTYGDRRTQYHIILEQMNRTVIDKLGRIPTDLFNYQGSNLHIISYDDYSKDKYKKIADKIRESRKNDKPACVIRTLLTSTSLRFRSRIAIGVLWPRLVTFQSTSYASQSWIDYTIYVCSSVGTWLGLSVLSLRNILIDVLRSNKVITYQIL